MGARLAHRAPPLKTVNEMAAIRAQGVPGGDRFLGPQETPAGVESCCPTQQSSSDLNK